MYLTTKLTDAEIAVRVIETRSYERFSELSFVNVYGDNIPEDVIVTSADGSVYLGSVEDADDRSIYVTLN